MAELQGDAMLAFFGAPVAHEADPEAFARAEATLVDAARRHPVTDLRRVVAYWRQGVERERSLNGRDVLLEGRRLHASVTFAEPNYVATAALTPNDPFLALEKGWKNARIESAWDMTTGSPGIVVALLDTGVDLNHPDLMNRPVGGRDFVTPDDLREIAKPVLRHRVSLAPELQRYIEHLRVERRLAAHTLDSYDRERVEAACAGVVVLQEHAVDGELRKERLGEGVVRIGPDEARDAQSDEHARSESNDRKEDRPAPGALLLLLRLAAGLFLDRLFRRDCLFDLIEQVSRFRVVRTLL